MTNLKEKASKLKLREGENVITRQQATRRPDRLSRREAALLSRAVILEETDPPQSLRATIWTVCLLVFGFFTWAALQQFDEKAVAPGEILPQTDVQPVQHLEGGMVSEVYIEEGDFVKAGEPLLKMADTGSKSERDAIQTRYSALLIQIERLRAYTESREPNFSDYIDNYPEQVSTSLKAYRSAINQRDGRLATMDAQISSRALEIEGLKDQQISLKKSLTSLREEVAIKSDLVDAGTIARLPFMALKRELTDKEAELAQIKTDIGRAGADLAEAQSNKLGIEAEMRQIAFAELTTVTTESNVKANELRKLNDRVARTIVPAPISGFVKGLLVSQSGAVIPSGMKIMDIVPSNDVLVAEVRVSPADIGHVRQGLPATIKIDTYKYGRLGGIKGTVSRISSTTFLDEATGDAYYKTLIMLEQDFVGPDPNSNRVTPGMTLVADITTGSKSLLAYLARPITYSLDSAFSER